MALDSHQKPAEERREGECDDRNGYGGENDPQEKGVPLP